MTLKEGDRVRLIPGPHIGKEATVMKMTPPGVLIDGEFTQAVPWVRVRLDDGTEMQGPESGVEAIL